MAYQDKARAKRTRHEWYVQNKERHHELTRRWYALHPGRRREMDKRYRERNRQRYMEKDRLYQIKLKREAFLKVAISKGDSNPRCRIDLTPNTAVSDLPCRGALQIDHMNGARDERRNGRTPNLYGPIVRGKRSVDDLRVLCQLHQLWNQIK